MVINLIWEQEVPSSNLGAPTILPSGFSEFLLDRINRIIRIIFFNFIRRRQLGFGRSLAAVAALGSYGAPSRRAAKREIQ